MASVTSDILIFESADGGDIDIINNDIALGEQLYQQAYLCLFGGCVESDTKGNEQPGQYRQDWWGNALLLGNVPSKHFNSQTERALRTNALNSSGRIAIISAVQADLAGLKGIANVTVDAAINSASKITITVKLFQPGGLSAILQLLWDNAKGELIIQRII